MSSSAVVWLSLLLCCSCTLSLPLPEEHDSEESRKVLGSSVVTSVSVVMENDNDTDTAYFTDAAGRPVERPKEGDEIGSPVDLITPDRYQFYTFDASGNLIKRYMTKDEVKSITANGLKKSGETPHDSPTFYHGVPADTENLSVESTEDGNHEQLSSQMNVHRVVESVQNILKSQLASSHEELQLSDAPMTPDTSASWSMILPSYLGNAADEHDSSSTSAPLTPAHEVVDDKTTNSDATSTESLLLEVSPADSVESGSGDKTEETVITEETTDEVPELEISSNSSPVSFDVTERETETATLVEDSEPISDSVEEVKEEDETSTVQVELTEKPVTSEESISENVNESTIPAVSYTDDSTAETDDEAKTTQSNEPSSSTTAEATSTEHVTSTTYVDKPVSTDARPTSSKPTAGSNGSTSVASESHPILTDEPESSSSAEESDEVSSTDKDTSVKEHRTQIPETMLPVLSKENTMVTGVPNSLDILQNDQPIALADSEKSNLTEIESLESLDFGSASSKPAAGSSGSTSVASESHPMLPDEPESSSSVEESDEVSSTDKDTSVTEQQTQIPETIIPVLSKENSTVTGVPNDLHILQNDQPIDSADSKESDLTEIESLESVPNKIYSEASVAHSGDTSANNIVDTSSSSGEIRLPLAKLPEEEEANDSPEEVSPTSNENLINGTLNDLNVTQNLSDTLSQVLVRVVEEALRFEMDAKHIGNIPITVPSIDETTNHDAENKSDVVITSVSSSHSSHSTSTSVSSSQNGQPIESGSGDSSGDEENSQEETSQIAVVDSTKPSQNANDFQEETKLPVLSSSEANSSVTKPQNLETKFGEENVQPVEILNVVESSEKMNDKRNNKPGELLAVKVEYNQVVPLIHPDERKNDSSSHDATMVKENTSMSSLDEYASISISDEVGNTEEKKPPIANVQVRQPEGSGSDSFESSGDSDQGSGAGSTEEFEVITAGHNSDYQSLDFTTLAYGEEKEVNDATKSDSQSDKRENDSSSHDATMVKEETSRPILDEDAGIPISDEVGNTEEKKIPIANVQVRQPEGSGSDTFESSGDSDQGSGAGSAEEFEVVTAGHNSDDQSLDFTTLAYGGEKEVNDATKSDSLSDESSLLSGAMEDVYNDVNFYATSKKDYGVKTQLQESSTDSDSSDITDVLEYVKGDKDIGLTTPSNKDQDEQNDGNLSNMSQEAEASTADYDGSKSTEYDVNKYVNSDKDIGLTTPSHQDVSTAENKDTTAEQSDENLSIFDVTKYANSDKDFGVTTRIDLEELNDEQQDDNLSAENIFDVNNYIHSDKDLGVTTPVDEEKSHTESEEQDVNPSIIFDVNKYVNSDIDLGVTTPMSDVDSETEIATSSSEDIELSNSANSESTTNEIASSTDLPEASLQESTTSIDDQEMNDEPLEVEDESDASENEDESHQQYYKTPLSGLKNSKIKPTVTEPEKSWTKVDVMSPHDNIQEESQETTQGDQPIATSTKNQSSSPSATPGLVNLKPAPEESLGLEASTAHLFEDVQKFADLCNELAFKMWLSATGKGVSAARSIVMSPFAITSLLSMIFLGAKGPTSGQMNDILKLDDMMTFNPHQVFRNVTESVVLEKNPGVSTAAFVRQLYSDKNKGKMLDFYKQRANEFYDGHIEEVDFATIGDTVRRRTNMLVKKQTAGKISEYMRGSNLELQPPLAAFSANIFQTDCSSASSEGRDGEMYFTVLPASRHRRLVPIPAVVYRSGFMAGYEPGLDATVISLGGHDSAISTLLVLPGQQGQLAPGDGLPLLEDRLFKSLYTEGAWSKLLRSLLSRTGLEVQIPRFSHRSQLNVTRSLQTMGLNDLFDPSNADLKGLSGSSNDLHVSDIVQVNTFSTCGEEVVSSKHHVEIYPGTPQRSGREGDASNEAENLENVPLALRPRQARIDMSQEPNGFEDLVEESVYKMPLALRPRQAREPEQDENLPRLKFDRPFLYFVRHNPTGFILHMGRFNPRLLN